MPFPTPDEIEHLVSESARVAAEGTELGPREPFQIDPRILGLQSCSPFPFDGIERAVREVYTLEGIYFQHDTAVEGQWVTFDFQEG